MSKLTLIKAKDIERGLRKSTREYLVGNLSQPQILEHVSDPNVEIGISDYQKDTLDKPHFHPVIAEYQYILEGEIILFDLDNLLYYHLAKGDFYAIPKGVKHVQLSKKDSRILFVKNKSINDKQKVIINQETNKWIHQIWKGVDK